MNKNYKIWILKCKFYPKYDSKSVKWGVKPHLNWYKIGKNTVFCHFFSFCYNSRFFYCIR